MSKHKVLLGCTILALGVSVLAVAQVPRNDRIRPIDSKITRGSTALDRGETQGEVAPPIRWSATIQEDGRWAIAGVVSMTKDVLGRNVIEVKKNGDFDTDAVLVLHVPLVELDTGEVVVTGIVSVKNNLDTWTLTLRKPASSDGTIASHTKSNGCQGAHDENDNFFCIQTYPDCSTSCSPGPLPGNPDVTICDCDQATQE